MAGSSTDRHPRPTGAGFGSRSTVRDSEAQDPSIVDGLRHSQQRLQFFLDHAPGAMAMLDRELRYLAVNREWQAHHAPDGRSLLGRSHYDVYPDRIS